MIYLVAILVYLMMGMVIARREYARMAYNREQLGINMPMSRHADKCGSHGWSSDPYKRSYCNCGYYASQSGWTPSYVVVPLWPALFVNSFIKGGTYTPKEVKVKELRSEEWEKMIEKELGINQPLDTKRRA